MPLDREPREQQGRYSVGSHSSAARRVVDGDSRSLSDHWTREQIEEVWDVFHQAGYALDRQSMYYDEGADSEFCETHRRSLRVALDLAGVVPKDVLATALLAGVEVASKVRDANQEERRRLEAENERLRDALNALDEFIGHDGTCEIAYGGHDCTCGFDEDAYTKIRALARGESALTSDEILARPRTAAQVAGIPDGEHFGTCSRCDDGRKPCICGTHPEER